MKTDIYKVRIGVKIPEFNFKKEDAQFFDKYKYTILINILTHEYYDFNPSFTCTIDGLVCEFDLSKHPAYNIYASLVYFEVSKKQIVEEIKILRSKMNKVPDIGSIR